jgi:hypothetical protein
MKSINIKTIYRHKHYSITISQCSNQLNRHNNEQLKLKIDSSLSQINIIIYKTSLLAMWTNKNSTHGQAITCSLRLDKLFYFVVLVLVP